MGHGWPFLNRRIFLVWFVLLSALLSVQSQAQQPSERRFPIEQLLGQFGIRPVPNGPPALSDRPTIDCTRLRNSVAQILCADRDGAAADWALNATIWALTHQSDEAGRAAFENDQTDWRSSLPRVCSLPPLFNSGPIPRAAVRCVHRAFRERTNQLKSKLSDDALAEARLAPEQRAEIQRALIDLGILSGTPDGEFGPTTREAIKKFQNTKNLPETGFFSDASVVNGLRQGDEIQNRAPTRSNSPVDSTDSQSRRSESQLREQISNLAEQRRASELELGKRVQDAMIAQRNADAKVDQLLKEGQSLRSAVDIAKSQAANANNDLQTIKRESEARIDELKMSLLLREQEIINLKSTSSKHELYFFWASIGTACFAVLAALSFSIIFVRRLPPPKLTRQISFSRFRTAGNSFVSLGSLLRTTIFKTIKIAAGAAIVLTAAAMLAFQWAEFRESELSCSHPQVLETLRKVVLKELVGLDMNFPAEFETLIRLEKDVTTDQIDKSTDTRLCSVSYRFDTSAIQESALKDKERIDSNTKGERDLLVAMAFMSALAPLKRVTYKVQPTQNGQFLVTARIPRDAPRRGCPIDNQYCN
jgi:peptidoglycan hydrolase-like protein with peptidoglycan-binding domain